MRFRKYDGAAARALASEVPADASVGASSAVATLLAERESLAVLPSSQAERLGADGSVESTELVAGLPAQGYLLLDRRGSLGLWRRQS